MPARMPCAVAGNMSSRIRVLAESARFRPDSDPVASSPQICIRRVDGFMGPGAKKSLNLKFESNLSF